MRVLVTGGARRIGAAIVRRLAADGHQVVIHYNHHADEAEALAAEVGGVAIGGELGEAGIGDRLIAAARAAAGGPVEAVVNNASTFVFDRPGFADLALLDRHMHVNLAAPVALAVALAGQPDLQDGVVVNLLDQKLGNLNPDFFSYTCSKLALEGATRMLAQALAPRVRVNAVAPGLALPSLDQSEAEFIAVSDENLLRRRVMPEDIADAVAFLLANSSVTGQNIFVDCGQRFLPRDGDVMFRDRERPDG